MAVVKKSNERREQTIVEPILRRFPPAKLLQDNKIEYITINTQVTGSKEMGTPGEGTDQYSNT